MRPSGLLDRNPEAWEQATRHPFLAGVRDGKLPAGTFESWLVQDYLFVADLLGFQARLFARAPRSHQAVLAGGLLAVEAELGWFEEKAGERGLELDAPRHPTTVAYHDFMVRLEDEPYAAGITALWALERAYLEAWQGASPGHPDYREFVEHWTTPEFADYVAGLEKTAGEALEQASGGEVERAGAAFVETCRLERDFWEMAWTEGGA